MTTCLCSPGCQGHRPGGETFEDADHHLVVEKGRMWFGVGGDRTNRLCYFVDAATEDPDYPKGTLPDPEIAFEVEILTVVT